MNIKKLRLSVAEYLGIDPLPFKYAEIGIDDSRLDIKNGYVLISNRYSLDTLETAKCLTHEYRHAYQIFYAAMRKDALASLWRKELEGAVNSETMEDSTSYYGQLLELDAFAFTKYYLDVYENTSVVHKDSNYEKLINAYITKNSDIL